MATVGDVSNLLEAFAPLELAEEWDNVGLLIGNRSAEVTRIMTCLTVTPASVAEAVGRQANLIVTHHPLPFQAVRQITSDTTTGRILLELIAARIAVYSPHTAFDSAADGINQRLADGLQLTAVTPLIPSPPATEHDRLGAGRQGRLPTAVTLGEFASSVKSFLGLTGVRVVGRDDAMVHAVGIACGSGGSLFESARGAGCDCFVTGETNFHTCLEAEATGVSLVLTGHFASERFAVERLAEHLASQLPAVEVWASGSEADPIRTV